MASARTPRINQMLATLGVAIAASIGAATAASAYNSPESWNTQASPLYKSGYGSSVWAAGTAYIKNGGNGTRIYNTGTHKFTDADNHRPYLAASSEWNAGSCASYSITIPYKGVQVAGSSFYAQANYDGADFPRANGVTHTTKAWTAFPTQSAAPNAGADRGRARVSPCIDIPFRIDPCSG